MAAVQKKGINSAARTKTGKDSSDDKKKALELALQQIEKATAKAL